MKSNKNILNFTVFKLICCVGVLSITKASKPDSPTYTVGVVEFTPYFDIPDALDKNIQGYHDMLSKYVTVADDTDIIIFPESSLNSEKTSVFVPEPKNKTILCKENNENSDMLSQLSCLASYYKKYMVFNIKEKENCTIESQKINKDKRPCSKDGLSRYNTNVVFDRNGTLISRYRKWNLYDGDMVNTTSTPEYVTFKTDFGVEFVSIVCFDVLWYTPTMEFVEKGYNNFVHPIWWFSELPFLTANQVHQGWAYAANVNLLTSAGNYAKDGATGTGVYNGRQGPIIVEMSAKPQSKILFAKVPKSKNQTETQHNVAVKPVSSIPERLLGLTLDRDITVNNYTNVLLNSTSLNVTEKVCYEDFCCEFIVNRKAFNNTENKNNYSYRLVAFSGPRKFNVSDQKKWMRTCAIIACTDDKSIQSCAKIFDDKVKYSNTHSFESIEIKADFSKQKKMLIMPNSVDAMMKALPINGFELNTEDKGKSTTAAVMKLKHPVSDLITFGIYADYYTGFNSASSISSSFIIVFIFALYKFLFL